MSEDESRRNVEEEQDEVEGHRRATFAGNDEGEKTEDDEVEAHRITKGHVKKQ
jgi:hypothetical protein